MQSFYYVPMTNMIGTLLFCRCYSCNCEMTTDDTFEDRAYLQLEDSTNLLHGIVHANGFGHLLRVNGREGGSKYLTGCDIMSFWDRLCQMLRVRFVELFQAWLLDLRVVITFECPRS